MQVLNHLGYTRLAAKLTAAKSQSAESVRLSLPPYIEPTSLRLQCNPGSLYKRFIQIIKKQKGCQQVGGCRSSLVSKRVFGTLAAEFEVLVFACLNGDQTFQRKIYIYFLPCSRLVLFWKHLGIWSGR